METVIVFDADNTLWDTDTVFRNAQLALLAVISEAGSVNSPKLDLHTLRTIDFELGKQLGNFEYDFKLLSTALLEYFLRHYSIKDSIHRTLSKTHQLSKKYSLIIERASSEFSHNLSEIPDLYPDANTVLSFLKRQRDNGVPLVTILFSEGDPVRLRHILDAHKIREKRFFNRILIRQKSKDAYELIKRMRLARQRGEAEVTEQQFIMVGDNLERDIKFANQAGFITIYKPSPYKGVQKSREPIESPAFRIDHLYELPRILNMVGGQPLSDLPHDISATPHTGKSVSILPKRPR